MRVNCGALPDGVVESELFGHERGAFTGAVARRKGRFELANGGTIFLDEIGDLPLATQVKLLRVLQEKEFERLGGNEVLHVDVRIIAATHRDLEQLVQQGQFREDLFYRLNVFPLYVPPLRDRRTDVLQLADHFVERFAKAANKPVRRISTPAIDMLVAYHWPGNVRELQNVIERAVLLSTDGVIHGHHLPPTLQTAEASHTPMRGKLRTTLDSVEREMIVGGAQERPGKHGRGGAQARHLRTHHGASGGALSRRPGEIAARPSGRPDHLFEPGPTRAYPAQARSYANVASRPLASRRQRQSARQVAGFRALVLASCAFA